MKKQCSLCGRRIRPAAHAVLDHTNQLLCPDQCGRVYNMLVQRDRLLGRAGMMAMVAHAQTPPVLRQQGLIFNALAATTAIHGVLLGTSANQERDTVAAIASLLTVLDIILEDKDEQQPDQSSR